MKTNNSRIDDHLHWYKDAIIYELHIKAFRDSNRDGVGDFLGLIEKLDYLQELGVTAIWVLPFYPSPLRDDGYDIADYYSINPMYGTMEQFQEFLNLAHKRKLKVITELVINHTSDQHSWFQRARLAPKDSPERNFYVWTDDPTQYKDVRIIFQDFESSNWTWDPIAQQYYWHRFFHHQPDLNFENPLVQEEFFNIIDFWCAKGVDGFRLDAVPYLFEKEGTNGENLPETHAYLKRLRAFIDEKYPGKAFLAEANMWPEDSASYFGNGDECHMNYHFPVMPRMFMSLQMEDRYPITDIFEQTPPIPETCQWAIFLRNHDELTLEMVTDEERDFMYKVYVKDPKAKINLGIRHRLAPLMEHSRSRIELMNSLLFSLPGTPVIYYGDEIGMGDNFYLGDRDGVRTPMQWSPDRNAGFSEANPQQLYLPVILDPEYHYEAVNVETQRRNTSSLFWFMKRMINMRRNYKSFGRGIMQFIHVDNPKILAFTRTYEDETVLVINNLSKFSQPAEIDLHLYRGRVPVEIFSKNSFPAIKSKDPYLFTLAPHSFQWFLLQETKNVNSELKTLSRLNVKEWKNVLDAEIIKSLQNSVLPSYLKKMKWFRGDKRKIYSLNIQTLHSIELFSNTAFLWMIEVNYESGLSEHYQLMVAFVTGDEANKLVTEHPESVIANLEAAQQEGFLCDAFYTTAYHQYVTQRLCEDPDKPLDITYQFQLREKVRKYLISQEVMMVKMHTSDQNDTSLTINNRYFLKMYRKIDHTVNPDVEISRYMSENARYNHVPGFLGTVQISNAAGEMVLGMVQALIENHGDGHTYMLERLGNYVERIMARDWNTMDPTDKRGSLADPIAFEDLPANLKELLGTRTSEDAKLIGYRTSEMHLLLAGETMNKDFTPEEYSLHYQRSLFSSMQSLVRETLQQIKNNSEKLPSDLKIEVKAFEDRKHELLGLMQRIYSKKLDIWKIRIHGTYHLKKLLMTGKDIMIHDFSGNPYSSFSERRIRRSPLRDIAEMMTSFHLAAYESFVSRGQITKNDLEAYFPFAEQWAHYMSGFFLKAYIQEVNDSPILPKDKKDLEVVLNIFMLEKSLVHLKEALQSRPDSMLAPLLMIKRLMSNLSAIPS